jgi:uncharacterized protein (DUF1501 family)
MTHSQSYSRRRLLQTLGVTAASLPLITLPGCVTAAGQKPTSGNILVLVELAGGNDGLNTVIPLKDNAYHSLRPEIGIDSNDTLSLDTDTGLHNSMTEMAAIWEDGALQIVQGVGYPNPNRSHFRSIEIWNAGGGANSLDRQGWVSAGLEQQPSPALDADGLVLGGGMGPLAGIGRFSAIRDEDAFLETQDNLPASLHAVRPHTAAPPLAHVLATYDSAKITGDAIYKRLSNSPAQTFDFPQSDLGQQLRTATRLLDAGVDVSVLKVVQGGYDTHDNQPGEHSALLRDLSQSIGAFTQAMRQIGLWNNISVVTFSEFGRTARENASGGTDHGTAAPIFVAGGNVRGGLTGQAPSLTALVEDDLVHTTDYRTVYGAILQDLWGIDAPQFQTTDSPLKLLAS